MALQTLIVDDEAPARHKLEDYLKEDPRFVCCGSAANGNKAVEMIETLEPDLVLLDVQLPQMTGFDVLRLLKPGQKPAVIFTTAYDQYALRAFEVAAHDYLLKPIGKRRFLQALDRFLKRSIASHKDSGKRLLEQNIETQPASRLALKSANLVHIVPVDDLAYIVSEQRLVTAYARDGKRYWTEETLDHLSRRLDSQIFFRIHRSSIVNLNANPQIEPWEDGRLRFHFQDGRTLVASRGPAKQLKQILGF